MEELSETTPEAPVAAEVSPQPENEAPAQDDSNLETQDDADDPVAEPELEEVDFNGAKYKLPKELAPIIAKAENLEAGVTKRFQEAAELRKSYEAQVQTFQKEQQINSELTQEISQLTSIESRLKQFQTVDWQTWQRTDAPAANAAIAEMVQLQAAQKQLGDQVEGRKAEIGAIQEQRAATQISQAIEALNKPDPEKGWAGKFDKTTADGLTKFGLELGYTQEELKGTTHPLMIKTLNLARLGLESLQKQKAAAVAPKPKAEPVPTIQAATSRATQKDPNKMSMAEFTKWREASEKRIAGR